MKINIAGAGAGKTTTMADLIFSKYQETSSEKNIYCITFTNNAKSCIENKLLNFFDEIPKNIMISTIHSFLYQEFIKPYYFSLYNKQFDNISTIKLPSVASYKNKKISDMEKKGILHVEKFSEKAKWVISKKSNDNKKIRENRKIILSTFGEYCSTIFIDEAQDIDINLVEIIEKMDHENIEVILMGDPKQDLNGLGTLRELAFKNKKNTTYMNFCYRCPSKHLELSNSIINDDEEYQESKNKMEQLK